MEFDSLALSRLLDTLKIDIELSEKVIPLLEEERERIADRDIDGMESLSKQKIALYEELRENQIKRDGIQQDLNIKPGFSGLKYLLKILDDQSEYYFKLKPSLMKLESLLHEINVINVTNAKTIALCHNQISGVLDIMFGKSSSQDCYGEDAQMQSTRDTTRVQKA